MAQFGEKGSVSRAMRKYGSSGKTRRMVEQMTEGTKSAAMFDGAVSEFFDVEQGVPHGRALSRILFHFVFSSDGVLRVVDVVGQGVEVGDRKVSGLMTTGDDFVIGTSDTPERL